MFRYPFVLITAIAVLAVCGCGQNQTRAPVTTGAATAADRTLPASVAAELAEWAGFCSEVGGTPHADNAVKRVDLNADGVDDFVLFAGWLVCENAWSIYGDRLKGIAVFAGHAPDTAALAFRDSVFDARVETVDDRGTLWLTTSSEMCGRPPAPTFAETAFCERAIVPTGPDGFEYAPVDTVRMIE